MWQVLMPISSCAQPLVILMAWSVSRALGESREHSCSPVATLSVCSNVAGIGMLQRSRWEMGENGLGISVWKSSWINHNPTINPTIFWPVEINHGCSWSCQKKMQLMVEHFFIAYFGCYILVATGWQPDHGQEVTVQNSPPMTSFLAVKNNNYK